jgi:tetrahydromethanopterin S-methyltransferase subunit H
LTNFEVCWLIDYHNGPTFLNHTCSSMRLSVRKCNCFERGLSGSAYYSTLAPNFELECVGSIQDSELHVLTVRSYVYTTPTASARILLTGQRARGRKVHDDSRW